jgi:hypothetical protein
MVRSVDSPPPSPANNNQMRVLLPPPQKSLNERQTAAVHLAAACCGCGFSGKPKIYLQSLMVLGTRAGGGGAHGS